MFNAETWVCDDAGHLCEMADYWKPKLGMADWAIELEVIPQIDISNESVAASNWLLSRRQGWIKMSSSDSRRSGCMEDDAEMSLVHELLHITFAAWHDTSESYLQIRSVQYDLCCEQPIDQLAETLVLMRRSSGHKFSFEPKGGTQ